MIYIYNNTCKLGCPNFDLDKRNKTFQFFINENISKILQKQISKDFYIYKDTKYHLI